MATDAEYLICHANEDGSSGVAQASVMATSEREAQEKFAERYPRRIVRMIGLREASMPIRRVTRGKAK